MDSRSEYDNKFNRDIDSEHHDQHNCSDRNFSKSINVRSAIGSCKNGVLKIWSKTKLTFSRREVAVNWWSTLLSSSLGLTDIKNRLLDSLVKRKLYDNQGCLQK